MTRERSTSSSRVFGRGLVLIGYRGTGKSAVGRILAHRLGRPFVDADLRIESLAGRPIASIFAEAGEATFRDWEERILAETTAGDPDIILATGGGAVLRESNRLRLRDFGLVVWLRASSGELASRLCADPKALADRPALTAAGTLSEIAQVLEARLPLYESTADISVETEGQSPSEVAERIGELWQSRLNASHESPRVGNRP